MKLAVANDVTKNDVATIFNISKTLQRMLILRYY